MGVGEEGEEGGMFGGGDSVGRSGGLGEGERAVELEVVVVDEVGEGHGWEVAFAASGE